MESCEEFLSYAELQKAETLRLMADQQVVAVTNLEDSDWTKRVACGDMSKEVFFPIDSDEVAVKNAKNVCDVCEVRGICLEYALNNVIEYGVWGGTSEKERRILIRERIREATRRYLRER